MSEIELTLLTLEILFARCRRVVRRDQTKELLGRALAQRDKDLLLHRCDQEGDVLQPALVARGELEPLLGRSLPPLIPRGGQWEVVLGR